jgi:hypothetical protein
VNGGEPVRRGRGRPPVGPEVRGLRLDAGDLAEIEALAEARGVTRSVVIRELVGEALEARRRKVARARPNG